MNSTEEVGVEALAQELVSFRLAGAWRVALAAALVAFAPPGLTAQKSGDATMPLPPGVIREKTPEDEVSGPSKTRAVEVWRVGASMEQAFGWYKARIAAYQDVPLDTAAVRPGEGTAISYHLAYHKFDDECRERVASGSSDPAAACKKWRRGADKRRALNNSRVALPDGWLEQFTFTWFSRTGDGALVRRQILVRDTGLSDDWQRDALRSQITLVREIVEPAAK
jgi:hypothetical protein